MELYELNNQMGPPVVLYISYHVDANPATPCETKKIKCLRSKEAILEVCATTYEGWDVTAQYIIKEVDEEVNLQVDVEDYMSLRHKQHVHIYRKLAIADATVQGAQGLGGNQEQQQEQGGNQQELRNQQQGQEGQNQQQGPDQGREQEDVVEEPLERIHARENVRGEMPTPYPLPTLPPRLVAKIRRFGRRMDTITKRKIADELRDDMLQYSNYAYPTVCERQRAAERLVVEYPELSDVTHATHERGTRGFTTWVYEITRSFQRWRRRRGQRDPALMALRIQLNIPLNRRPALNHSREYNPNAKAERKVQYKDPLFIGQAGVLDPEVLQYDFRNELLDAWRNEPGNENRIIDLLNRTTTIRRKMFTDGSQSLEQCLEAYPPLTSVVHIWDDMERFYHMKVAQKIKEFFTMERCLKTVDLVMSSRRTPQPLVCAFLLIPDGRENHNVLRDLILAALPALAGRDYTNSWYTVGRPPVGKAPAVRIDSESLAWPDYREAKYKICADTVTINPSVGDFTFTDAVITGLSLLYLCNMKVPANACASWRFLAEDVCGLPVSSKTRNAGQVALHNLFFGI